MLQGISAGLSGVQNALKNILGPILSDFKEFFEWFYSTFDEAQMVLDIFYETEGVVDRISDVLSPIKWTLQNSPKCIFNKVALPVLSWTTKVS